MVKFAHLADVHIGAWRDPLMASLPDIAFEEAISVALAEKVDFILIAGDLFNAALPGIDHLRRVVRVLSAVRAAGVRVYVIPGSHDFSPTGKSMLHVLEEASLIVDVFKGEVVDGKLRLRLTKDEPSGVFLTGILGRRGMLDRVEYESLDKEWLEEQMQGKKGVFLFHTALEQLRPKELDRMPAQDLSLLPRGFSYYAGGHVHIVADKTISAVQGSESSQQSASASLRSDAQSPVVYPGPVFPASFSELESLGHGGLVIVEDGRFSRVPVKLKELTSLMVSVNGMSADEVTESLLEELSGKEVNDALVLLRLSGQLRGGTVADIDFRRVFRAAYDAGAYFVMRNTVAVRAESVVGEELAHACVSQIEESVFSEFVGKVSKPVDGDELFFMRSLLKSLGVEKVDGQTRSEYEDVVVDEAYRLLGLDKD